MDATSERLGAMDQFEKLQTEAADAMAAVLEHSELGAYEPKREALLEALNWLEINITCGDCIGGRCHWGGQVSEAGRAAVAASEDFVHRRGRVRLSAPCGQR